MTKGIFIAVLLYSLTRQGGGGNSLIWSKGVCAAEQGKSFIVLGAKQGIQIIFTWQIEQGVFLGSEALIKERKISNSMMLVWNDYSYFILFSKWNKS